MAPGMQWGGENWHLQFWVWIQGNGGAGCKCTAWAEIDDSRLPVRGGRARALERDPHMGEEPPGHLLRRRRGGSRGQGAPDLVVGASDPRPPRHHRRLAAGRLQSEPRANHHHRGVGGVMPSCGRELWAVHVRGFHAQPPVHDAEADSRRRNPRVAELAKGPWDVLALHARELDASEGEHDHRGDPLHTCPERRVFGRAAQGLDQWRQGTVF